VVPARDYGHDLDAMLAARGQAVDKVLNFSVPDAVLVERVTGRWVHAASGRSYHTKFAPPRVPGVDDQTGEPLNTIAARVRRARERMMLALRQRDAGLDSSELEP
jgi:adenylate kinase family enzyme